MIKILTAVIITFSISGACLAMDDINQLNANLSVKSIIRAKLWYEGINIKSVHKNQQVNDSKPLPEELTVALDKLDAE